jgi:hypothetical protein
VPNPPVPGGGTQDDAQPELVDVTGASAFTPPPPAVAVPLPMDIAESTGPVRRRAVRRRRGEAGDPAAQLPAQPALPLGDVPGKGSVASLDAGDGEPFEQPALFAFSPDADIHLGPPGEAIATLGGSEPERTMHWLNKLVGGVRPTGRRRCAFSARALDRLLCLRSPHRVTLDASATAVARALWARDLGFKALRVTRHGQRLVASSQRWPTGWKVVDAPWPAILCLDALGVDFDVDARAQALLTRRLGDAGHAIATAGLAGSAIVLDATRPDLLESLGLPALGYLGAPGTGRYRMPLLAGDAVRGESAIRTTPDLDRAIARATARTRAVSAPPGFPWTLFAFQARDLGRALRIVEHTGGVLLAGDMGSGKSQHVNSLVYCPGGPRRIGDLEVGDQVLGSDGQAHAVTGVYPQGRRQLYRVTFTDHTSVDVDGGHLWSVRTPVEQWRDRRGRVLTTLEILEEGLRYDGGELRHYIPTLSAALQFTTHEPTLPGYVLGALLGEGWTTAVTSTPIDGGGEVCALVQRDLDRSALSGTVLTPTSDRGFAIHDPGCLLTAELEACGVWGKRAWEASIPDSYKYAPTHVRIAVLQGLLDTGGDVYGRQSSSVAFTSTSERLTEDVAWLVQSLGGTACKETPHRSTPTHNVEQRGGQPSWRLTIALPEDISPFRCAGKATRYGPGAGNGPARGIVSIEPTGVDEAVCISVGAPDQLYVTEHAIVTHNTTVSLALIEHTDAWPLLVVAPLAAFSTWERQLGEMGRDMWLCTEPKAQAFERFSDLPDAVVISYDRLHDFVDVIEHAGFAAIVADEIQRIRTPGSRRSRALRQLAGSVPLRVGLSGTPITNKAEDILPLGAFLVPGEWPPRLSARDLNELYPGAEPIESLAEHLGTMMVRRRMEDVGVTLPGRDIKRVFVPLSADQRRALEDLEAEARAAKEAGELGDHLHVFARLQKMRQVQNVPDVAGVQGPNTKLVSAIDLAQEFAEKGQKSIIFVADRKAWLDCGKMLEAAGIGWTGIWGSTPISDRIANEKRYHADDDCMVFVGTLAACGESLTLSPTARATIFASLSYSPSTLSQAAARAYRMNTTDPVTEVYLCAQAPGGTLDDRIWELLTIKRALFAQIVDRSEYTDPAEKISLGDLVYLLTGERDEQLDLLAADSAAEVARAQAKKAHARATAHRHKTGEFLDDGEVAELLEDLEHADDDDDALDRDWSLDEGGGEEWDPATFAEDDDEDDEDEEGDEGGEDDDGSSGEGQDAGW